MREEILRVIYAAIDEVNMQAADGAVIDKDLDAALLGGERGVDSLLFVNLVVAVEEQVQKTLKKSVVLVDEDSMALHEHPFRTVGTLANYVEKVVDKQQPQ